MGREVERRRAIAATSISQLASPDKNAFALRPNLDMPVGREVEQRRAITSPPGSAYLLPSPKRIQPVGGRGDTHNPEGGGAWR